MSFTSKELRVYVWTDVIGLEDIIPGKRYLVSDHQTGVSSHDTGYIELDDGFNAFILFDGTVKCAWLNSKESDDNYWNVIIQND